MSQAVRSERIQNGDFGASSTNYAAARLSNGNIIVAKNSTVSTTRGDIKLHSEYHLIKQADDLNLKIVEVFSERSPCSNCNEYLKNIPEDKITYSVDYANKHEARRNLQSILEGIKKSLSPCT